MPKNGTSFNDLSKVRLTNLEKILYPAAGITKEEVITHYIRYAPFMLPVLLNRPLTMHRFPEGIGGEDFYEKDTPRGTPDYVDIFTRWSKTAQREVHFIVCNNLDTLIWMANLASLEIHATLSTTTAFESPDLLLFDIDPEPPVPFDEVIDIAHIVHERLENDGIRPYVKTSGKKGLHIVVPLVPGTGSARSGSSFTRSAKQFHRKCLMSSRSSRCPGIPERSSSTISRTLTGKRWLRHTA